MLSVSPIYVPAAAVYTLAEPVLAPLAAAAVTGCRYITSKINE
jgi:hypothetical protein